MKYAVIETGGKQYRVAEGDVIYIEKLDAEAGSTVKFDRVLAVTDEASGSSLGTLVTSMKVSPTTQQQALTAGVMTFPLEDLFVAFQGVNADNTLSISVKVNPLIMLNWIGAGVAVLGIVLAFAPRRATPLLAADDRAREEGASHGA